MRQRLNVVMQSAGAELGQRRMLVVGIVGGIGSGKSAVANWVASRSGMIVIEADKLGHEAIKAETVRDALRLRFGPTIFGEDGFIVRSALAKQVFGDHQDQKLARVDLEKIVHPEIKRQISHSIAIASEEGAEAVLLDAAVLLEAGWRSMCDLVVFVDTPDSVRLERVRQNRGWTKEELDRREASQWSLSEKRRESDLIVANDRNLEYAGRQLLESLQHLGWLKR
jgi:dephospho-CoA kinase